HGYMSFPIARQRRCSMESFWYPTNGDGITDPMCRAAYQYVYDKVLDETGSTTDAISAAQYEFQQDNEYAALAGPDYWDKCHITQQVVPNYLCAAGAHSWSNPFGDKSGVDISGSWRPTVIPLSDNHQVSVPLELEFCPTAVHEPSYYEVYITKPSFNVFIDRVVWGNLDLIYNDTVPLDPRLPYSICDADLVYRFTVPIPIRQSQAVLYVRWQRLDPVGEGFYNCVDINFDYNNGPDDEDIIVPDVEGGLLPNQCASTFNYNEGVPGFDTEEYYKYMYESLRFNRYNTNTCSSRDYGKQKWHRRHHHQYVYNK
uniref:Fusolin n=1 Tax=unidentified entomopoxvirus TaxID=10291 RepID=A0A0J9X287_9POXV|nr:Chain A, FUSOLIN [unidentified entomopoxvirus]